MGLAFPIMGQNVFENLLGISCTVAIGRLGAPELAASSLANSVYTVTGLSLVMGLSSAMEPLCGQAYGAKEYKTLGDLLQRALLVSHGWHGCFMFGLDGSGTTTSACHLTLPHTLLHTPGVLGSLRSCWPVVDAE